MNVFDATFTLHLIQFIIHPTPDTWVEKLSYLCDSLRCIRKITDQFRIFSIARPKN